MFKLKLLVTAICAAVIFLAFFLPWVSVESGAVGAFSKALTGKAQATISAISGFQVPILANGPDSRFMLSVIQIFNPKITNADKKSWLIWGVPIFAIVLLVLSFLYGKNEWVNLAIGALGIAIFIFAAYKISVTDLDKLVLKARIDYGLWLVILGYLGMGIVHAGDFALGVLKRK